MNIRSEVFIHFVSSALSLDMINRNNFLLRHLATEIKELKGVSAVSHEEPLPRFTTVEEVMDYDPPNRKEIVSWRHII